MYNRIVVPVDGSTFSEEVIPYALGIATTTGAKLTLLRVIEKDANKAKVEKYVQALAARFGVEGRSVSSRGNVAEDILDEVKRIPGTLVTINSHGRGDRLNALLGSVARDVVRAGHVPVLVYRPSGDADEQHDPVQITTVLLPLGGTRLSETIEAEAAGWARSLKATLMVVQVLPANARMDPLLASSDILEDSYVRGHARDQEREYGIRVDWEVLRGDPVASIARYLEGRRDVLVVMATRGQPTLQAAVLGSVTSGLLQRAGVPIIVQAPVKAKQQVSV
ncbi:universal stress protein [Glaciibacter superstes]|uniref:universal stress protein n=1 Tax=Glaciibacter superstes TaxID=501023 RepID=UPI0003B41FEF|nr:universal stress protein [Glaciibacter superstes]